MLGFWYAGTAPSDGQIWHVQQAGTCTGCWLHCESGAASTPTAAAIDIARWRERPRGRSAFENPTTKDRWTVFRTPPPRFRTDGYAITVLRVTFLFFVRVSDAKNRLSSITVGRLVARWRQSSPCGNRLRSHYTYLLPRLFTFNDRGSADGRGPPAEADWTAATGFCENIRPRLRWRPWKATLTKRTWSAIICAPK